MAVSGAHDPSPGLVTLIRRNCLAYIAMSGIVFGVTMHWFNYQRTLVEPNQDLYGHDYISFYTVGLLSLEGHPASAYDLDVHLERQLGVSRALRGQAHQSYYYFGYPPTYLTIITPFALLGYYPSVLTFLGSTMALAYVAIARITRDKMAALAALGAPVTIVTSIFGQNAFLTTGLIGLALVSLEESQVLAGVLIGLLGFKPQLGLAFPIVLIAGGYWRAVVAAAMTVVSTVLLSIALFGLQTWTAFFAHVGVSRNQLLENSVVGFSKIESLFALLRFYDVPLSIAYAVQGCLMIVVAGTLIYLWRRRDLAFEIRAAAAATGTLLITPFCLAYDLTIELVAMGFLYACARSTGWRSGEIPALLFIAASPAIAAFWPANPWFLAGFLGMALLFGIVVRRAWAESRQSQHGTG